jgi:hypothetical protein
MKKLTLAAVLALAAIALVVTVATAKNGNGHRNGGFHAKLDSFQEVPKTLSTTGEGKFKARLRNGVVEYKLRYSGLEGGATTEGHIHLGRPAVAGGGIAFLCGGGDKPACPPSGEVTGTIDPADVIGPAAQGIAAGEFDEFVRAMKAGATYANVHTPQYPDGEIRGQIGKGKFRGFGLGNGNGHKGDDDGNGNGNGKNGGHNGDDD